MSLQNLKSKAITLKDKILKLERDGVDLDGKYEKVIFSFVFHQHIFQQMIFKGSQRKEGTRREI